MRGVAPAVPGSPLRRAQTRFVIPAKAGIHFAGCFAACGLWIPASAGMTGSVSGFCPVSQIGTRPRCLSRNTRRRVPAAPASVEPSAILLCHSRERGNPLRQILRHQRLLDSCLRRNDRVSLGILPCFGDWQTPTLPFLQDPSTHSGRTQRCGTRTCRSLFS